ncbi:MAG: hypothetical protein KGJ13_06080 [Patescibacteria group bacterium]|nr:hypothetical protein [Patescibacteria group bacterium]
MNWSTKRKLQAVERLLDKMGLSFSAKGYTVKGGSTYLWVEQIDKEIRISDHAQPPFGGFAGDGKGRYGKSDYSVEPRNPEILDLKKWLSEEKQKLSKENDERSENDPSPYRLEYMRRQALRAVGKVL